MASRLQIRSQLTRQPLLGKRVVVTRAPEQVRAAVEELEDRSAEVLLLPLVCFADPLDFAALDRAISGIPECDWVIFTSQNAVRFFAKRCRAIGREPGQFQASDRAPRLRVAALGAGTNRAAESEGFHVDFIPSKAEGAGLAREISNEVQGRRVLLPRSDIAMDDLPAMLRSAGAEVTEVIAYRTMSPAIDERGLEIIRRMKMRPPEIEVVTFASPSAFRHFVNAVGLDAAREIASNVAFAAIGSTTAKAIRDASCQVAMESTLATASGLADAIERYYEIGSDKVTQK